MKIHDKQIFTKLHDRETVSQEKSLIFHIIFFTFLLRKMNLEFLHVIKIFFAARPRYTTFNAARDINGFLSLDLLN